MKTITARNVNHAYALGAQLLYEEGEWHPTRNGSAIVLPEPVTTRYELPCERVLFDGARDANPFFHVMESLWMLAGRADVAWLAQWLKSVMQYSDNELTFHGAYGSRWRHWPVLGYKDGENGPEYELAAMDQLEILVKALQENPSDRRLVLGMWDPARDLGIDSKDIPCNDLVKFRVINGLLCMIVFNRSNDMIWGAYGANVVQFSMLQEYLAGRAGLGVGWYEQVSTDFHAYEEEWRKREAWKLSPAYGYNEKIWDPYEVPMVLPIGEGTVRPFPLVTSPGEWDKDNLRFIEWCVSDRKTHQTYSNDFFNEVAEPLAIAHRYWKEKHRDEAMHVVKHYVGALDWSLATYSWMERRKNKSVI